MGVGGGKEALRFAYFSRRPGAVIAVDPVAARRDAAKRNLAATAACDPWFDLAFVSVRDGDAFSLGVDDTSVDIVAGNCLSTCSNRRISRLRFGKLSGSYGLGGSSA